MIPAEIDSIPYEPICFPLQSFQRTLSRRYAFHIFWDCKDNINLLSLQILTPNFQKTFLVRFKSGCKDKHFFPNSPNLLCNFMRKFNTAAQLSVFQ